MSSTSNNNQIIYNLKLSGGTLRKKMSSTSNNKKYCINCGPMARVVLQ